MTPDQIFSLWDSAIKIGLGAVIGAVAAHFAARSNFERDLQKEHLRRRQDAFDALCGDFEQIHQCVIDLHVAYSGHVRSYEAAGGIVNTAAKKVFDALQPVGACLMKLHTLEGKLKILGLDECSRLLCNYRVAMTDHQSSVVMSNPNHSSKQLDTLIDPVLRARDEFYATAAVAYKQP